MAKPWKRVVLKLSGEALMGSQTHGLDQHTLDRISADIAKAADAGFEIAVVVGGDKNVYSNQFVVNARRRK